MVEDLALACLGRGDQVLVEHIEDVIADIGELGLDLVAVGLDLANLSLIALALLLLLDGGNDSPGSTAGSDDLRSRFSIVHIIYFGGLRFCRRQRASCVPRPRVPHRAVEVDVSWNETLQSCFERTLATFFMYVTFSRIN